MDMKFYVQLKNIPDNYLGYEVDIQSKALMALNAMLKAQIGFEAVQYSSGTLDVVS